MYSNEDIESAVAAKIISRQAAQALRDHVAGVKKTSALDEENFRLLTGFNDLFVVMASLLLLGALFFICVYYYQQAWLGGLLVTGASWALAEYFVRQRHMALPAIVLLFTFIFGVGFATVSTLYVIGYLFVGELVAAILTALAALLHWRRFRTPITLAAGLGTVLLYVLMSLNKFLPAVAANVMPYVVFCMGLLAFAGAMYWDISDLRRQTRHSDIAFWLHLLAAPLLVHPVFNIMLADTSLLNIILILTLYVLIASFSLAIDRRALLYVK
ncbi:hypothetical protein REG_1718 [Candidatus Regiella insecticola LSR1]|uniref:Uncharacterized protein n=1 Tax=Candidatus Regiella insecticola LSR1 TaxID=663321 RepID=E0WUE1_9ENTR|nr:hypothetical protein [Candidatus Regiella insecticola]EFL91374.1 hypothetical protein REG_1718 [Candidatus Regiella insecticola LSR1]